jgi:type IV pilus assembly protein PilA
MNTVNDTTAKKKYLLTPLRGFTLIELMVAIAIIGILATLTIPSLYISRQRTAVAEVIRKTENIRDDITAYYKHHIAFPSDNDEAGLPEPELLIGNRYTRMQIEGGAIHITLGNKIAKPLQGKIISLRPAVVTGSPSSPISWLCGTEQPVAGMEAAGVDKTDVEQTILPASCD